MCPPGRPRVEETYGKDVVDKAELFCERPLVSNGQLDMLC